MIKVRVSTVKVVLKDKEEKIYQNAQASIGNDGVLSVTRTENCIAQFHPEYYQYWEYMDPKNSYS